MTTGRVSGASARRLVTMTDVVSIDRRVNSAIRVSVMVITFASLSLRRRRMATATLSVLRPARRLPLCYRRALVIGLLALLIVRAVLSDEAVRRPVHTGGWHGNIFRREIRSGILLLRRILLPRMKLFRLIRRRWGGGRKIQRSVIGSRRKLVRERRWQCFHPRYVSTIQNFERLFRREVLVNTLVLRPRVLTHILLRWGFSPGSHQVDTSV